MKKTLKQLADELGVSKDKVKYQARKLSPSCTVKEGGITYLTEQGEAEIRKLLGEATTQATPEPPQSDPMMELLRSTIDMLQHQIAMKDEQIGRLQDELEKERQHSRDLSDKLADLADHAQQLHAGTMKKEPLKLEEKPRRGLFSGWRKQKEE